MKSASEVSERDAVNPPSEEEALCPELAEPLNAIWNFRPNANQLKKIVSTYKQPENVKIKTLEINQELTTHMSTPMFKRDSKLKSVQNAIMRTAYPLVGLAQSYKDNDEKRLD